MVSAFFLKITKNLFETINFQNEEKSFHNGFIFRMKIFRSSFMRWKG